MFAFFVVSKFVNARLKHELKICEVSVKATIREEKQ